MSDVRNMVEECDDQESPECVILQAWTNNTTRQTAEDCHIQAKLLIGSALRKFPSARIIISSVLPRLCPIQASNWANVVAAKLNRMFSANCSASSRISFVDHTSSFVSDNGDIRCDLYWDYVHPNNRGPGKLISNLRSAIDALHPTWEVNLPLT